MLSQTTLDKGRGKSGIHLAVVSVFARIIGENRHFRDLSQQVLFEVVAFDFSYITEILCVC